MEINEVFNYVSDFYSQYLPRLRNAPDGTPDRAFGVKVREEYLKIWPVFRSRIVATSVPDRDSLLRKIDEVIDFFQDYE